MPPPEARTGSDSHPRWLMVPKPAADARPNGKRTSHPVLADRTRTSLASLADWKRTFPLKRAVSDWERFVLTLHSIEGGAKGVGGATTAHAPARSPLPSPSRPYVQRCRVQSATRGHTFASATLSEADVLSRR